MKDIYTKDLDTRFTFRLTNEVAQALYSEAKKQKIKPSKLVRNILSDSLK